MYLLQVVEYLLAELLVHLFVDSLGNGSPHPLQLGLPLGHLYRTNNTHTRGITHSMVL